MTLPIRLRLALVCAALVAGLIVALGAVVYLRLEADLLAAVDDELLTRAEALNDQDGDLTLTISPTDVGDIFAQRVSPDGRIIATSPGLPERLLVPATDLATMTVPLVVEAVVATTDEPVPARLMAVAAADGTIVIVGVTIDDQRSALSTLLLELALAMPVAVVLAGGVGWLVAGAALRPVEAMRLEAEAISGAEPERRLPVSARRDELSALGGSLNRMLDRLQAAVERERRFVDDASHELRTPLANLKAELDLALRRSRTEAELIAALRSATEETDRLTGLAEDLLVLARADGGRLPIRREVVDVSRLLRDTVESFEGRAASLDLSLVLQTEDHVFATLDAARIRQAVGNLIDNGMRHTPPGGRVTVTMLRSSSGITITVADAGDGFPPSFLRHAFEPFSRADVARSRSDGGAGLGLAIVRAVVEAHGGTAEARNGSSGGAEVMLRMPA